MLLAARNVSKYLYRNNSRLTVEKLVLNKSESKVSDKYKNAFSKFQDKIIFNSHLESQKIKLGYRRNRIIDDLVKKLEKEESRVHSNVKPLPLVLNQLCDNAVDKLEEPKYEIEEPAKQNIKDLPFSRNLKVEKTNDDGLQKSRENPKVPLNWLQDYELYDETEDEIESTYGTPNPTIPVSQVPCGGCGALLHCKESSIPGYLPSELFQGLSKAELTTITCQRCHFLINYNTAINVTVTPDDYVEIISKIKDEYALAIVMIDLLDFPCSIWPGIKDILGPKRPIFIVGNKVDLLPKDSPNYLNHIKECLRQESTRIGFEEKHIRNISLISAKTGYGVEELITQLHNVWKYKGDVYLIGCTNVGKSSLFNALLRSDYCKVEASNIIQKATACPWPGTTLRMLKFPILRPSDHRIYMRTQRLKSQRTQKNAEDKLRRDQAITTKKVEHATLIGHIGRTFEPEKEETSDPVSQSHDSGFAGKILTLNENSKNYIQSKWCYDTPGVVQPDQILHLLTTDEIIKTIPKEMIKPRTFLMKPSLTMFIAGIGRLDFIEGPPSIRVTAYSSLELPITICETADAEEFYESFLGSEIMGVPIDSGEERLAKWPKLQPSEDILVEGEEKHITVCDIVLSSAGWVGINLPRDTSGTFKAWTPEQRGIYVRCPALLPYGVNLRGPRIRHSLAYRISDSFTFQRLKK